MGERSGRVKSRNLHKGPMDKDSGGGLNVGGGGGSGRGEQWGKMGTTVIEQQ